MHADAQFPESLFAWFHLQSVPGVGRHLFKRLLLHFGSPQRVLHASAEELQHVEGITRDLVRRLHARPDPDPIRREIDLARRNRIRIITWADREYPALLRQIPDPPPILYVKGRLEPDARCLAVVGSRTATAYGLSVAERFAGDLCTSGLTVVSGMARGIDTAAHRGALLNGGPTIAVLGSGLLRIYPPENQGLFRQIAESGAVISEFALQTGPDGHNFPLRNRVISGMSLGTLVVEAARKSGSLITARLAAEQNREVFAVPGSIRSFKSAGTHSLIRQGAKLVESLPDILEELAWTAGRLDAAEDPGTAASAAGTGNLGGDELKVYQALSAYPVHIDDLQQRTQLDAGRLAGCLLQLELKGLVRQAPGKRFLLVDEC